MDPIRDGAIHTWTHAGVECAIRAGLSSLNGYVRLPEGMRAWWADHENVAQVLDAHGGLTYGVDERGWVGFDTAHVHDMWAPDDLIGHLDREGMMTANTTRRILENHRRRGVVRWTMGALRAEVERLAVQVAALTLILDTPSQPDGAAGGTSLVAPTWLG